MIRGIGTDIVQIERIRKVLKNFGQRFPRRILSGDEYLKYSQCQSQRRAAFLAKRFAAKEAVAKAIGRGIGSTVSFSDIEVCHDPLGKPLINFGKYTSEYLNSEGIRDCHISIADEKDYAVAFAVLS